MILDSMGNPIKSRDYESESESQNDSYEEHLMYLVNKFQGKDCDDVFAVCSFDEGITNDYGVFFNKQDAQQYAHFLLLEEDYLKDTFEISQEDQLQYFSQAVEGYYSGEGLDCSDVPDDIQPKDFKRFIKDSCECDLSDAEDAINDFISEENEQLDGTMDASILYSKKESMLTVYYLKLAFSWDKGFYWALSES